MKKEEFTVLIDKYSKIKKDNEKIKNNLSLVRLIIVTVIIALAIVAGLYNAWLFFIPGALVVGFIFVSKYHKKYFKIIDDANFKITVLKEYLSRLDNTYKKNSDAGNDLKDDSFLATDLDLYGKSSLFSYLSFAKTPYGRQFLSNSLKANIITKEDLLERQEAIHELASSFEEVTLPLNSMSLKFNGINDKKKVSSLENAFNLLSNEVKFNPYYLILNFVMLAVLVGVIVLASLKKVNMYLPLVIVAVSFMLTKFLYPQINDVSTSMTTINNIFYGYNYLIDEITNKNFKSKILNDNKKAVSRLSSKSIKSFKIISSLISGRNNVIFQIIFNGIFLLDGYLILAYVLWQRKYKNDFKDAIISIGKIEELASLATVEIVKENSTLPKISDEFTFENIMHPLISEEVCVGNSFKFTNTNIITGSNMSGKTTFMRAIGVNYILFLSGAFVNAGEFNAPICKLYTSMKVVDDVNNNISTFYGEILRVKEICNALKEDDNIIVLVDEIFKGTNTIDRITGASAFVEKLINSKAYAIITTHDAELCDIKGVKNFHFIEHYNDDKIAFDYKIRDGVSNTRNAIYLLKLAGVID